MSEKGVVDYIDIRVVDGSELRFNVRNHLNSEFSLVERCIEEFRSNVLSPNGLALYINKRLGDLRNKVEFLKVLELMSENKFKDLVVLLDSYCDEFELLRRERGIEV